jgi:hypothetical protein
MWKLIVIPVVLDEDEVTTIEGDSLLHVVAACGDGEDFLRCAKMIVHDYAAAFVLLRCA